MWRSAVQLCLGLPFEGGLAQLARAPALQAGGQRFESVILHIWDRRPGVARSYREIFAVMFLTFYDMLHKKYKNNSSR